MIETTVQLICDGCETVYQANMLDTASATRLRLAAGRDGWTTVGRGRTLRDICPVCIPRVKP